MRLGRKKITVYSLQKTRLHHCIYPNDFDNFDPYNAFLAIATNIPVLLKTGFVVQGHIFG